MLLNTEADVPQVRIFEAGINEGVIPDFYRHLATITPPPTARDVAFRVIDEISAHYVDRSVLGVTDDKAESGFGFASVEGVPEDEVVAAAERAFPGGVQIVSPIDGPRPPFAST